MTQNDLISYVQNLANDISSRMPEKRDEGFYLKAIYSPLRCVKEETRLPYSVSVMAALMHQRERGIEITSSSWLRMEHAIKRLIKEDRAVFHSDAITRILVTDMAIRRLAYERLSQIERGEVFTLNGDREDPDIAHISQLGVYHTLLREMNKDILATIAFSQFERLSNPLAEQISNLLKSARDPLHSPIESSIRGWTRICSEYDFHQKAFDPLDIRVNVIKPPALLSVA